MSNYAVVNDSGIVINVIDWDGISPYNIQSGTTLVLDTNEFVAIGWTYDGTNFIAPLADSND